MPRVLDMLLALRNNHRVVYGQTVNLTPTVVALSSISGRLISDTYCATCHGAMDGAMGRRRTQDAPAGYSPSSLPTMADPCLPTGSDVKCAGHIDVIERLHPCG